MVLVTQPVFTGLDIDLPNPPSDPATLQDIFYGIKLAEDVKDKYHHGITEPRAQKLHVASAEVYLYELCHQHARSPATVEDFRALLRPLEQKIENLLGASRRVETLSVRAINSGRRDGEQQPYEVLPFVNNEGATEDPGGYNLPRLTSQDVSNRLSTANITSYLDRYGITYQRTTSRNERLIKLKVFLGC